MTEQPCDGLFGLSIDKPGDISWWWHIVNTGQVPGPEYSFYMEPGHVHGSQLTLGGRDHSKFKGPVRTIDLDIEISHSINSWVVDMPAIYVDGKIIRNSTAPGKPPLPFAYALLDGGTSFMGAPNYGVARDLYASISPLIKQLSPHGIWGAPCHVLDAAARDVTFTFGTAGGRMANLTMPKEFFNAGPLADFPGMCQGIFVQMVPDAV